MSLNAAITQRTCRLTAIRPAAKNFFDLRQKEFIQFSGEMLNSKMEKMRESKMTISNRNERKGWAGIIKQKGS